MSWRTESPDEEAFEELRLATRSGPSRLFRRNDLDLTGEVDESNRVLEWLQEFGSIYLPATDEGERIRLDLVVPSGCFLGGMGAKPWNRSLLKWENRGTLIHGSVRFTGSKAAAAADFSVDSYADGANLNGVAGLNDETQKIRVRRVNTRANNHGQLWEKNLVDATQVSGPVGAVFNDILVEQCFHYGAVALNGNGFVSKMRGVTFRDCFAFDCLQAFVAVSDNINGQNTYSRAQETYFENCKGSSNQNTLRVYSRDTRSLGNTYNVQPVRDIFWNGGVLGDCSQAGAHIGDFSAQTSQGPVGTQTLLKNEGVWIKGARITECGQNGILFTRLDGGGYSDNYFSNNGVGGGGFTNKHVDWDTAGNVLNLSHGPNIIKGASLGRETLVGARTASSTVYSCDEGVLLTNEGAAALVAFTLPTAEAGRTFRFYVQDADGIRVVAAAGDTIRVNGSVSAVAGRIDSTTVGSFIELMAVNATEWIAVASSGTWTVT